jgi:hypothetical protein
VKQSDLGEYEEDAIEKSKYTIYMIKHQLPSNQGKSQAPPQTKSYGWQRPIFKLKRVARKAQDFSMQKTIPP